MSCLGAFRTNLRMFRELCESTMRQSGPSPKGLRGVAELQALEALYAGERPFRGDLLKPLSAFCNLLVSGQLPGAFTRLNLGDACGALGEVLESRSTRRWRFDPDLSKRTAARLGLDRMGRGLDRLQRENQTGWAEHATENMRFISSALERVPQTRTAVIVGGGRAYDIPLGEIVRRFEHVILVDVCEEADVRAAVRRVMTDSVLLGRISVERFDLTGTYNQFVSDVSAIVARAKSQSDAEREVDEFVSEYDVPAAAVRLCRAEMEPDLVVSSMVLTQLGLPFKSFAARAFQERGFGAKQDEGGMLDQSLSALACRVEQHHVAALLRVPRLAVLTSDISETAATLGPSGEVVRVGEPRTQLSVESLLDRIPSDVELLGHAAWDWLRVVPKRPGAPGASMIVEGVVLKRRY